MRWRFSPWMLFLLGCTNGTCQDSPADIIVDVTIEGRGGVIGTRFAPGTEPLTSNCDGPTTCQFSTSHVNSSVEVRLQAIESTPGTFRGWRLDGQAIAPDQRELRLQAAPGSSPKHSVVLAFAQPLNPPVSDVDAGPGDAGPHGSDAEAGAQDAAAEDAGVDASDASADSGPSPRCGPFPCASDQVCCAGEEGIVCNAATSCPIEQTYACSQPSDCPATELCCQIIETGSRKTKCASTCPNFSSPLCDDAHPCAPANGACRKFQRVADTANPTGIGLCQPVP